jgi:hypothetical protein
MSATTVTPNYRTTASRIETAAEDVRKDITATIESIRSTAGDVGNRVPGLVDDVRNRAAASAREVDLVPAIVVAVTGMRRAGVGSV